MKIHYFSRVASFPFIVLLIYFFVHAQFAFGDAGSYILIPSVTALVMLYIFHEPIDQWWWKKHPPLLDAGIKSWLLMHSSFYASLNAEDRKLFERRLSIFIHIKDFTLKEKKDYHLEDDTKALIAHYFIWISFRHDDYLFDRYHHFIAYNHAFGSPEYQFLHSFEYHYNDGVVIYARDMLLLGLMKGQAYFDIGLYSAIVLFISIYPRLHYPDVKSVDVESICHRMGTQAEGIYTSLGYKEVSKMGLMVYFYFKQKEVFKDQFPDAYKKIEAIFDQPLSL